jgi:hypothetical protein
MRKNNLRVEGRARAFGYASAFAGAGMMLAACSNSPTPAGMGTTGTSSAAGSTSAGATGSGTTSSGMTSTTGATSGAGTSGASSTGGASTGTTSTGTGTGASSGSGTAGSGSDGGGPDATASEAGPTGTEGGASDASYGGDGPVAKAGCANNNYPLCIDFENGIDTTLWTGGTPSAIVTTDFAHGGHSYKLYPMGGGTMTVKQLGTITNQLWGRFYVHFKPEAPYGHGNILGAYDPANNWYEIGWQFNGILGDYHLASNRERATRSKPVLVDQWYCIESFFDGTATNMPVWWIDGQMAAYYMPDAPPPVPVVLQQFAKITVGFTPYAALGLNPPYGSAGPPALSEMYIDDIAFDTKRIGCIQ